MAEEDGGVSTTAVGDDRTRRRSPRSSACCTRTACSSPTATTATRRCSRTATSAEPSTVPTRTSGPHIGPESERRVIDPDYDFGLMALVNMDDPELVVLPYHRVAEVPEDFDADAFAAALARAASTCASSPRTPISRPRCSHRETPAFGVLIDGRTPWVVSVKPDVDLDSAITSEHSRAWKHVDTAVLQELVLDRHPRYPPRPARDPRAHVVREGHATRSRQLVDATHVAFVMRATGLDQLRAVALSGETMPQKSTYFYPKVPAGFVLRSIDDPSSVARRFRRAATRRSRTLRCARRCARPRPRGSARPAADTPRRAGTSSHRGRSRAARLPAHQPRRQIERARRLGARAAAAASIASIESSLDEPAAQEDPPHLDVVGDLTALAALELHAEVPGQDLDRHDRLLAPDPVERRQPLGHLDHVVPGGPDPRRVAVVLVEQLAAPPTRSTSAASP